MRVLLDEHNAIKGYDFLGKETRARAIIRFFNIIVGPNGSDAFDFPCKIVGDTRLGKAQDRVRRFLSASG